VRRGVAPDPQKLAARVAGYRIGPIADAYLGIFDEVKQFRTAAPAREPVKAPAAWPFGLGAPRPVRASTPIYGAASHRAV
jgi:hypothetical protein